MPPAADAKSTKSREKIAEIQRTLSEMEYLSSGTLLKRIEGLRQPPAATARTTPAARHGPYFEWSYVKGGKLQPHRTLTPAQADIMRLAIANQRKAKKLLRVWEAQTLNLIELTTPR